MNSFVGKNKLLILAIFIFLFLLTCNYHFESVDQPDNVDINSTFEVDIKVSIEAENQGGIPYFGILLPVGWTVLDSIPYSGTLNGTFIHSVAQSDTMELEDQAPEGYYWWVSVGDTVDSLLDGTVSIQTQISTNGRVGMFFLDYMLGDDSNGLNMRRSDHHPISVGLPASVTVTNTNDSGVGSLRQAIDTVSSGGEIRFDLLFPATILLDSQLVIDRSIQIIGPEEGQLTISAGRQSRIMWINENLTVSILNLNLSDGLASTDIPNGGAIYSNSSNIFLGNMTISNNSAGNNGGGIYIGSSEEDNPAELCLDNVTIANNSAGNNGGGIYIGSSQEDPDLELILSNVQVRSNSAAESGGGICCENTQNSNIERTVITENGAKYGGGLYFWGKQLNLLNVTVQSNDVSAKGGGIFYTHTDSATFTNSVIAANNAFNAAGIYCENSKITILTNLTFADNKTFGAASKGGAILSSICEKIFLINSILWNNLPDNIYLDQSNILTLYSNIKDWRKNEGNIDADPIFADSIHYYLSENSPCIDAGHPDTLFYDPEDAVNPGNAVWPALGTKRNDMGAYGGHGKFKQFKWDIAPALPEGTIHAIDFVDDEVGWLASQDYLLKTEDGGQNWHQLPANTGWEFLFIDFINESLGWAIERDKVNNSAWMLKTENGGNSWLVQKKLTRENYQDMILELQVVNSNVVFALTIGSIVKIYNTLDGGSSWRAITFPDETMALHALHFIDIFNGIAAGGNGIQIFIMKTVDGGNSWETLPVPYSILPHSLQMVDYESSYFVNNTTLYKTYDSFASWKKLLSNVTAYYALDKYTIFAIVGSQKFVKSINGGSTWQEVNLGEDVYTMIQFADHLNGWVVGADGSILKTNTGGDSWFDQKLDVVKVLEIEEESPKIPDQFFLSQNYPNPFNPLTSIEYQLPANSHVEITIVDLLGQTVETLVSARKPAGYHQVQWNAGAFASGIYYYIIRTDDFVQARKMILLK